MSYPSLQQDANTDALIIGGGITGALVALELTKAGIETMLIDKRDIGAGSTSASTALLQYELDVPLRKLIQKIGHKAATRNYQLCLEAVEKLALLIKLHRIDCGFEKRSSLFLARFKQEIPEFEEEYRLRREMGIELTYFNEKDIQSRFPFSRPAALYSQIGGQVDPHALTYGLLGAGTKNGLVVHDRTQMVKMRPHARGVEVTTQNGHRIKTKHLVIAAGFEANELLKISAGKLKNTYAMISEPIPKIKEWHQQCLIWNSGTPYLYMRTTSDGRVIVGGEDEDFTHAKLRDALISSKGRTLLKKFKKLFPAVPFEVAYQWAGTFGETKDGLPYIGAHPHFPRTHFALGYGGNGITFSLIAAEILRDTILGHKRQAATSFRFNR